MQEFGKDALFDSLFPDLKQFKARCSASIRGSVLEAGCGLTSGCMCMYVCMYVCIYIYIYIYILFVYTYIYIYIHAHIFSDTHTHTFLLTHLLYFIYNPTIIRLGFLIHT